MKNKLKKIITTTVISAVSLTAIGCGTNNSKLAQNINKSMDNFVSSINNLDYVETASAKAPTNRNIGKIVETSTNESNSLKIRNTGNHIQFLNNNISEAEIENTITIPSMRSDNFSLFILTNTPYITFTSNDNENVNSKFSTNLIEETSSEIESKISSLILKRSILMIYVNEIYNGNVNLSNENKLAINAYVNVIKENTSYLNGNRGMVKNQLSLASDLVSSDSNENLINYYIIKSGEALETRASKLDSAISAIDSIIKIIEENLSSSSTYYRSNLSNTYNNLVSNTSSENTDKEITEISTNQEIANKIACTLDFCNLEKTSNQEKNTLDQKPETRINDSNQNQNKTSNLINNSRINNQNTTTLIQQNDTNQTRTMPNPSISTNQEIEKTTEQKRFPRISNRKSYPLRNTQGNNSAISNQQIHEQNQSNLIYNQNQRNKIYKNNQSEVNMNNNSNLRTNKTIDNLTNEEYTSSSFNEYENRATRVPYKTTSSIQR